MCVLKLKYTYSQADRLKVTPRHNPVLIKCLYRINDPSVKQFQLKHGSQLKSYEKNQAIYGGKENLKIRRINYLEPFTPSSSGTNLLKQKVKDR